MQSLLIQSPTGHTRTIGRNEVTRAEAGSHQESEVEANVRIVVRMLMAARGVKPAELALRLGVSKTAIFNRLGGHKPFTLAEVGEMAVFFEVPAAVLLAGPHSLLRVSDGSISVSKLTGHSQRMPVRQIPRTAPRALRLVA
jgi:antitoxin component HigA of HigAB toxin-antitoxin module